MSPICSRTIFLSPQDPNGLSALRFRATERVEGVVRRELAGHVLEIVLAGGLEARGERVEPGRLRRETTVGGIRAADDEGKSAQGWIVELVLLEEGIERAIVAVVPELDARDIIGDRLLTLCDLHDLRGRNEEECRLTV